MWGFFLSIFQLGTCNYYFATRARFAGRRAERFWHGLRADVAIILCNCFHGGFGQTRKMSVFFLHILSPRTVPIHIPIGTAIMHCGNMNPNCKQQQRFITNYDESSDFWKWKIQSRWIHISYCLSQLVIGHSIFFSVRTKWNNFLLVSTGKWGWMRTRIWWRGNEFETR